MAGNRVPPTLAVRTHPPASTAGAPNFLPTQNYPERYLYELLLAARKHLRSGKSTFHLGVLPTSRTLTAHLAAGLQRAEVGV